MRAKTYDGHHRTVKKSIYSSNHPWRFKNQSYDKRELHKHDIDAIDHLQIIYNIKHHVYVGDYTGLWESGPL